MTDPAGNTCLPLPGNDGFCGGGGGGGGGASDSVSYLWPTVTATDDELRVAMTRITGSTDAIEIHHVPLAGGDMTTSSLALPTGAGADPQIEMIRDAAGVPTTLLAWVAPTLAHDGGGATTWVGQLEAGGSAIVPGSAVACGSGWGALHRVGDHFLVTFEREDETGYDGVWLDARGALAFDRPAFHLDATFASVAFGDDRDGLAGAIPIAIATTTGGQVGGVRVLRVDSRGRTIADQRSATTGSSGYPPVLHAAILADGSTLATYTIAASEDDELLCEQQDEGGESDPPKTACPPPGASYAIALPAPPAAAPAPASDAPGAPGVAPRGATAALPEIHALLATADGGAAAIGRRTDDSYALFRLDTHGEIVGRQALVAGLAESREIAPIALAVTPEGLASAYSAGHAIELARFDDRGVALGSPAAVVTFDDGGCNASGGGSPAVAALIGLVGACGVARRRRRQLLVGVALAAGAATGCMTDPTGSVCLPVPGGDGYCGGGGGGGGDFVMYTSPAIASTTDELRVAMSRGTLGTDRVQVMHVPFAGGDATTSDITLPTERSYGTQLESIAPRPAADDSSAAGSVTTTLLAWIAQQDGGWETWTARLDAAGDAIEPGSAIHWRSDWGTLRRVGDHFLLVFARFDETGYDGLWLDDTGAYAADHAPFRLDVGPGTYVAFGDDPDGRAGAIPLAVRTMDRDGTSTVRVMRLDSGGHVIADQPIATGVSVTLLSATILADGSTLAIYTAPVSEAVESACFDTYDDTEDAQDLVACPPPGTSYAIAVPAPPPAPPGDAPDVAPLATTAPVTLPEIHSVLATADGGARAIERLTDGSFVLQRLDAHGAPVGAATPVEPGAPDDPNPAFAFAATPEGYAVSFETEDSVDLARFDDRGATLDPVTTIASADDGGCNTSGGGSPGALAPIALVAIGALVARFRRRARPGS